MNKNRRKELYTLINRLTVLRSTNDIKNNDLVNEIKDIKLELGWILSEEEAYMDNIPENMQNGNKYQIAEEACDNLESAIDALDDGIEGIDDAIDYISNASV